MSSDQAKRCEESFIAFTNEEWRLLQAHLRGFIEVFHGEAGSEKCPPHQKDSRLDWRPPAKPMFEYCEKPCTCGHECGLHSYVWDSETQEESGLCVCLHPGCSCKKFEDAK